MALDNVLATLSHPLMAGVASFAGPLGLAAGALPVPSGVPGWLPYVVSILGPILTMVVTRVLAALAARKRALAAVKEKRAKELLADKNPDNDANAHKLEDEAAELRADADALEAARK